MALVVLVALAAGACVVLINGLQISLPWDSVYTVRVEATSPTGRPYIVFESPVAVPANAADVRVSVVAPVGADWEEGVWTLRFLADGHEAGGGQFWLARDPSRFDFAASLRKQ